jgi:DNA-directed RNA polymerase sigma subunit (sigma70/sigma32)
MVLKYMDENSSKQLLEIEPSCSEETVTLDLRRRLLLSIRKQVVANVMDVSSACILSLRMGLTDGVCYSLKEVSVRVHLSPEVVRRRQYQALRRCVGQLAFLRLLGEYARLVRLPRGVTYYLYKLDEHDE